MDIETRLRILRAKKRWSQKELGEHIGVAWTSVSRWENNKAQPHRLALKRIEELEKECEREFKEEKK